MVEDPSRRNQLGRVSVTLDVDFRTSLIGGLPTCSELCRRRKAMRSTLASVSRGSASSKARNSSGHWREHHMMAQFPALFGVTQEQAYRSIRSNRRQGIPSPGLARSDRTSPSLHQVVKRLAGAPQVVGKADHPTSLERHNEDNAITTMDCGVV